MDDIRQQCEQLENDWSRVFESIKANPAVIQPYLTNVTSEQLNEVVSTIAYWLKRVRAPQGFAPGFHVAKGVAATSLSAATGAAQALSRGEYGHFPSFVVALNQILSALHSMLVFSDKALARDAVAELGGKLAEGLALLGTAQRELEAKTILLKAAEEGLKAIQLAADAVTAAEIKAQKGIETLQAHEQTALQQLSMIEASVQDAARYKEELAVLTKQNTELQRHLDQQSETIGVLSQRAIEQQELIAALLPKGASAGLASAFGARVGQLERTKWIWMGVFIVSILGLVSAAYLILRIPLSSTEEMWRVILHRLPLAAPLIWLGWFSAIQYGNTLRVQEDYAFKEATSKAFAGYRDHMEYMASVSLEEGNSAMTLLAAHTIEILAREPLRIFQGVEKDVSPSHSLLEALHLKSSGTKSEEAA